MFKFIISTIFFAFSALLAAQTKPTAKPGALKSGTVKSKATSKAPISKGTTKRKSTVVSNSKPRIEVEQILGSWQLINYQFGPQAKKRKPLTTCDTMLRWNFVLDSTTKKTVVNVVKTEECADYGFESDWQISGNNLLIKRTKILGFGGVSASGSFFIKQISKDQMILEFQKNKYIFRKVE